jgi:hypothetical protein
MATTVTISSKNCADICSHMYLYRLTTGLSVERCCVMQLTVENLSKHSSLQLQRNNFRVSDKQDVN